MGKSDTIIKVKDLRFMMTILIAFCLFPVIFFFISYLLNLNYILSIVITGLIYLTYTIFFVRRLKREENVYALSATEDSLILQKHGTFYWNQISTIETFLESPLGNRSPNKYIKFVFANADDIIVDATNYDIDYEDLRRKLLEIKHKHTETNMR